MTIAACYVASEGVVFGADSTTTIPVYDPATQLSPPHHYTFGQKVFEFGDPGSSTGLITWGLGSLGQLSYRTLIAEVADTAKTQDLPALGDLANLWARVFWAEYVKAYEPLMIRARAIAAKGSAKTTEDCNELDWLFSFSVGFCLGGRWRNGRRPGAFEIMFHPLMTDAPVPGPLAIGSPKFWGCPNLMLRLAYGIDPELYDNILASGKWTGTRDELFALVNRAILGSPQDLPIREAIDLVYASIYTTIKGMKFSHLSPICGGPIEIAVVTTDRPFRWVCHKEMCEAVSEGCFQRTRE